MANNEKDLRGQGNQSGQGNSGKDIRDKDVTGKNESSTGRTGMEDDTDVTSKKDRPQGSEERSDSKKTQTSGNMSGSPERGTSSESDRNKDRGTNR